MYTLAAKINTKINSINSQGIFSIIIIVCLMVTFSLIYFVKKRRQKINQASTGFILLVDLTLYWIRTIVINVLGKRFHFLTPYAFFLLLYVNLGNLLSLFGLESPMTFLSVPLSLGLITFLGIHIFGIIFRGWRYFKKFLNPLEIISQFAPFISISFRIFGNLLAGFFIMFLFYKYSAELLGPNLKYFNILSVVAAPFHMYFDIFTGFIQSFIFMMLTLTYWSFERPYKSLKNQKNLPDNDPKLYNEVLREN